MSTEKMVQKKDEYVPGVCNIGPAEIRRRRAGGWFGLAVTLVLWSVLHFIHAAPIWRLLLFIPAVMGATGFLQAAFHFCAGFGMRGLFNFRGIVGETDTVMQAEFRKKDRQKAMTIVWLSVLIGAVLAVAAFLIRF